MFYSIGQGFRNIFRHFRLSLASIATVAACIFIFCIFFSIAANLRSIIAHIETRVGITVFFEDDIPETQIKEIGNAFASRPEVKETVYTSAEEAWEEFKSDYFAGREELAEGFADDNPLKNSASYTVYLKNTAMQQDFVDYAESVPGVRTVNASAGAAGSLTALNRAVTLISLAIIAVLLVVSVVLISNTITVSAEFRKREIGIMKLVGATNAMVVAPFIIEGVVLGLIGAAISLAGAYFLYGYSADYLMKNFAVLSQEVAFLPIMQLMPYMAGTGALLGAGLGFFVSLITIQKHTRV